MSDSEAVDDQKIPSLRLDQRSRLVILSREISPKKNLPQLPEIKKVGSGIFIVERKKRKIIEFLEDIPHVRFRKAREMPKGDSRKKVPYQEPMYSIVVFSFEKPTQQQKKKMQRIIHRTPCIRLRPGVILLPHMRAKEKARYFTQENGTSLFDSNEFAKEARSVGAHVKRWARLRLVNKQGESLIQEAYKRMIEHEVGSIESKLKAIEPHIKETSISTKKLREQYSNQSRKLKQLRNRHKILRALWHYDEEKQLKRVYNFMLRTRRKIQER